MGLMGQGRPAAWPVQTAEGGVSDNNNDELNQEHQRENKRQRRKCQERHLGRKGRGSSSGSGGLNLGLLRQSGEKKKETLRETGGTPDQQQPPPRHQTSPTRSRPVQPTHPTPSPAPPGAAASASQSPPPALPVARMSDREEEEAGKWPGCFTRW